MSGGDVVYTGWLRKSPPEKKLRRYITKADFPELLEQHKRPLYILLLLVFISSCAVLARPGWPKSPYTPE